MSPEAELHTEPTYRTSSFCSGGDCLAVAQLPDAVRIRDTKDRSQPEFVFPAAEWAAFVAEVKRGGFS